MTGDMLNMRFDGVIHKGPVHRMKSHLRSTECGLRRRFQYVTTEEPVDCPECVEAMGAT